MEVRLFALGYLSARDVDTLQLVDYALCTLVETHRRQHLALHSVDVSYYASCTSLLRIVFSNKLGYLKGVSPYDVEAISLCLDPNYVGCIDHLELWGRVPADDEVTLINHLRETRIPIKLVTIMEEGDGTSTKRLTALINSQLRVGRLKVEE